MPKEKFLLSLLALYGGIGILVNSNNSSSIHHFPHYLGDLISSVYVTLCLRGIIVLIKVILILFGGETNYCPRNRNTRGYLYLRR